MFIRVTLAWTCEPELDLSKKNLFELKAYLAVKVVNFYVPNAWYDLNVIFLSVKIKNNNKMRRIRKSSNFSFISTSGPHFCKLLFCEPNLI